MKLPHCEAAHIAKEKITDYLLNPLHPDGASKAAFFAALGFTVEEWRVLADAFETLVRDAEVAKATDSPHGTKYVVDGALETPSGKMPMVRTIWIVDKGEESPRLVTAYPRDPGVSP